MSARAAGFRIDRARDVIARLSSCRIDLRQSSSTRTAATDPSSSSPCQYPANLRHTAVREVPNEGAREPSENARRNEADRISKIAIRVSHGAAPSATPTDIRQSWFDYSVNIPAVRPFPIAVHLAARPLHIRLELGGQDRRT
jgi:hypothetical protein